MREVGEVKTKLNLCRSSKDIDDGDNITTNDDKKIQFVKHMKELYSTGGEDGENGADGANGAGGAGSGVKVGFTKF